jgi:uncharacterized membrane-anchored protein
LNLGFAIASIIFIGIFVVAVAAQIRAKSFHPFLYWAVIIDSKPKTFRSSSSEMLLNRRV